MAATPHATGLQRFVPAALRFTDDDVRGVDGKLDRTRKDWALDVLAVVIAAVAGVATHIEARDGSAGATADVLMTIDLLIAPIGLALLFFRRRWPLPVALATAALAAVAPSVAVTSLIVTFAVASWSRPPRAFIGIAAMLVSIPISGALLLSVSTAKDPMANFISNLVFGALITVIVGVWGLFSAARRQLMVTLEERAVRAESEQALRMDQARAGERTRIAREMHDVLAHRMSLLSVHAGALEFRPDAPPEEIARAAGVIRATAHEALEELRTVIGVMRVGDSLAGSPSASDGAGSATAGTDRAAGNGGLAPEPPQPTLSAVPHLVEEWQQAGARIDLDLDQNAVSALPPTVGRTAYRIVQEALTNAGKHAPTARVAVQVGGAPGDGLVVSVANPLGVGLPDTEIPGTGLGLVGLRERTELAGGVFAAGIDEDLRRFVLEARLPWPVA